MLNVANHMPLSVNSEKCVIVKINIIQAIVGRIAKTHRKIHPPNEVSRIKSLTCIELNTKQGAPSKVMNILQTARELLFDADDIENLGERKSHHFSFVCKFACSRN